MNRRFNFKPPYGVDRYSTVEARSVEELAREVGELRSWLRALTEQLEHVIGKEIDTGEPDSRKR